MFHKAKPRQFNYRPIYYDPERERLEKRRDELLGKRPEDGQYKPGDIIRGGGLRAKGKFVGDPDYERKFKNRSNGRLLIILALLAAVAVIVFWWKP